MRRIFAIVFVLLLAAAAAAAQFVPLKPARASLAGVDAKAAREYLVHQFARDGWTIFADSQHRVAFARDFGASNYFWSYALLGNYAITGGRTVVTIDLVRDGEELLVTGFAENWYTDGWGRTGHVVVTEQPDVRSQFKNLFEKMGFALRPDAPAPPLEQARSGRLTILATRDGDAFAYSAIYSPASPSTPRDFASNEELVRFLVDAGEMTEDQARAHLAVAKKKGRATLEYLAWPKEKLFRLGLTSAPK